jgi:hypothetical protein
MPTCNEALDSLRDGGPWNNDGGGSRWELSREVGLGLGASDIVINKLNRGKL